NISQISSLIGDPARAKMMIAFLGGKALSASELALEANITSQTASSHLAKLVEGSLIAVQKQGRHRYFQLKGQEVAKLLELLLHLSSGVEHSHVKTGPRNPELRTARVCYDHLAGRIAVQLFESVSSNGYLAFRDGQVNLTAKGRTFFENLGADLEQMRTKRRPLCRSCLDWSERRHHLAGSLGQWILSDLFKKRWAKKDPDSRVIGFTKKGLDQFSELYFSGI
ncbi:MAG: winged helix-turn-helix transcriptional regulator, partial [Proteobacteria bacterium]|nr:winged helix-turn-helix transcriptional regulator [Pseudomonadota bacterium]